MCGWYRYYGLFSLSVVSDSVAITRSPSTETVYTSESLILTCVTTLNPAVDIPVRVTHQWVGPGGAVSTGNGVAVSVVTGFGFEYSSTISIAFLSSSHSGTYTCTSTVAPSRLSVFLESSAVQTTSTQFTAG